MYNRLVTVSSSQFVGHTPVGSADAETRTWSPEALTPPTPEMNAYLTLCLSIYFVDWRS